MTKRIQGLLLGFVLMTGGAAIAAADDHGRYGETSIYDAARRFGYRDGYGRGIRDRRFNVRHDYNSDEYRRADAGYRKSLGSKGRYQQRYRDAYRRGYDEAFRSAAYGRDRDSDRWGRGWPGNDDLGRGGYGRSEGARIAWDFGFADGVWYAQQDMRRGRRVAPQDCKGYKDADHGYSSRYDRDEFKRAYREAFVRAYQQTFRRG